MLCAELLTALEFEPGDELDPVAEGRVGGAMLNVDNGRRERCKDSISVGRVGGSRGEAAALICIPRKVPHAAIVQPPPILGTES